jgi:hypothetical protein
MYVHSAHSPYYALSVCVLCCDCCRGEMQSKRGILGKVGTCATAVCCCHIGGDVVTGQSDGSLYLWKVCMCTYIHNVRYSVCIYEFMVCHKCDDSCTCSHIVKQSYAALFVSRSSAYELWKLCTCAAALSQKLNTPALCACRRGTFCKSDSPFVLYILAVVVDCY